MGAKLHGEIKFVREEAGNANPFASEHNSGSNFHQKILGKMNKLCIIIICRRSGRILAKGLIFRHSNNPWDSTWKAHSLNMVHTKLSPMFIMYLHHFCESECGVKSVFIRCVLRSCNPHTFLIFASWNRPWPPQPPDRALGSLYWAKRQQREHGLYGANDAGDERFHRDNCLQPSCLEWLIRPLFTLQHLW